MRFFTPREQARARAFYEREGFVATGWEGLEEPLGLVLVEYALDGRAALTSAECGGERHWSASRHLRARARRARHLGRLER